MSVRQLAVVAGIAGAVVAIIFLYVDFDAATANLGAEFAGLLLGITVTLLAVDKVVADQQRARYQELRWATGERALDAIEVCAEGFIYDIQRMDPDQSDDLHLWFRPEPDPENPDLDAAWWHKRNRDELDWRRRRLKDAEDFCAKEEHPCPYPDQGLRSRRAHVVGNLVRLEALGDRLAGMTDGTEADVAFLRWIWHAADKRHDLFDVALDEETGYDELVWREVRATLHSLRRAYEYGIETRTPPE